MVYLRARYYSPDTGRFISEDPIRSGMNWYAYCHNDPINFVDPTGLFEWSKLLPWNWFSSGSNNSNNTSAPAPESRWVNTQSGSLTMRSSLNGTSIGSIPKGAEVSYTPDSANKTGKIGGHQWAMVTYGDVTGWVAATYLTDEAPNTTATSATTDGSGYVYPLAARHTLDPNTGGREFGASRSGGRLHAGMDLITPSGTGVIAMTGGTVIENNKGFYAGTDALIVQNADGTVTLYGEIRSNLSAGATITQGQTIGSVIANNASGASMLHIEYYSGTASGSIFGGGAYRRRSDLASPMFIQYLP